MIKLIINDESVEIHAGNLTSESYKAWIKALKEDFPTQKLRFVGCTFNILTLGKFLPQLQETVFEQIEFIDCSIQRIKLNNTNTVQSLFLRLTHMLQQASRPMTVLIADSKENYCLSKLSWFPLLKGISKSKSTLILNLNDEDGNSISHTINDDKPEFALSLKAGLEFLISFKGNELSLSRQESTTEQDESITYPILLDFLTQAAEFASASKCSLNLDVFFNSRDTIKYAFNAQKRKGVCEIGLWESSDLKGEEALEFDPREIVVEALPDLLSSLPCLTQFDLFSVNQFIATNTRLFSSSVFSKLEDLNLTCTLNEETKALLLNEILQSPNLRDLTLIGLSFEVRDMALLARILISGKQLERVCFHGCGFSNELLENLASELQSLSDMGFKKHLRCLELKNEDRLNGYNDKALKTFLKIIELLTLIEVSHDFGDNKKIKALLAKNIKNFERVYTNPLFDFLDLMKVKESKKSRIKDLRRLESFTSDESGPTSDAPRNDSSKPERAINLRNTSVDTPREDEHSNFEADEDKSQKTMEKSNSKKRRFTTFVRTMSSPAALLTRQSQIVRPADNCSKDDNYRGLGHFYK